MMLRQIISVFGVDVSHIIIIGLVALCAFFTPCAADDHSGTILTETWELAGSPHNIIGNLTVTDACTLTIEAGCEVLFDGNYALQVNGALIADGNPANHITFTSNQTMPAPGDWMWMYFNVPDAGTILDHCDISYGGSNLGGVYHYGGGTLSITNTTISLSANAGVYVRLAAPVISNCTISNNATGIQCYDGTSDPVVTDCIIQDNGGYAVRTFGGNVKDYTGTMTISGNGYDAFLVGNDNNVTGTWLNHGVPYVINGHLKVPNGTTMTIVPGDTLKFNGNYQLQVDGALIANGDPSDHITFTSNQTTPAPGDWMWMYFNVPDAGTVLDYCDISYGGSNLGDVYHYNGGTLPITNSTISHSANAGVYIDIAAPVISNCTISENAHGIQCDNTVSDPVVTDCTIQNNGGYAVVTFGGNVKDYTGTMTIGGNGYDAFLVGNDDNVMGTWLNHGVPYVINGHLKVPNGTTLTIVPGDTLKFNGNYQLQVDGTLIADGDPSDHITFTSNQATPAPGDWMWLYFNLPDAGTVLDYCDISYGGSNLGDVYHYGGGTLPMTNSTISHSANAGVYVEAAAPVISSCTLELNTTAGLQYIGTADATLSDCTLQSNQFGVRGHGGTCHFAYNNQIINNTSYGIYLTGACTATFGASLAEWNDIYGNGTYDFYNGTSDIYAYYVYWGTTDAGTIATNIHDFYDDGSLGIVYFAHWLDPSHTEEYGLTSPVIVDVYDQADSIYIEWNPVPEALSYRMYSSDDPYAGYSEDVTGLFNETSWTAERSEVLKFYQVRAVAGAEESGPSNLVGYEEYGEAIP